jgi:hypothetical protein
MRRGRDTRAVSTCLDPDSSGPSGCRQTPEMAVRTQQRAMVGLTLMKRPSIRCAGTPAPGWASRPSRLGSGWTCVSQPKPDAPRALVEAGATLRTRLSRAWWESLEKGAKRAGDPPMFASLREYP